MWEENRSIAITIVAIILLASLVSLYRIVSKKIKFWIDKRNARKNFNLDYETVKNKDKITKK